MNKTTVFGILLLWLALITFSASRDSTIIDMISGVISVVLGLVLLILPVPEMKKKYRPLGLIVVVSGLLMASMTLFRGIFP